MNSCIYCGSDKIRKYGKNKEFQQYECKSCKKRFNENSKLSRNLIINGEKYCNACNKFKPLDEYFYYNGSPRSKCKKCFSETSNNRYRFYDISEDIYDKMLSIQNNKCAICEKSFESKRKTFIDHNHKTNNVRGLLCPKCNTLLGHANDSIIILNKAIEYLIKYM